MQFEREPDEDQSGQSGERGVERDIDGWRQIAERSQEQLQLAFDLGGLGTWDWDVVRDQVLISGCQEQLLGLPQWKTEFRFAELLAYVHPEDREAVQTRLTECLERGEQYSQEFRVRNSDGSVIWIESRARIHRDDSGAAVRMAGILQVTTERKAREVEHRRFQALFEAAQDAVLIADDERRYVDANPAAYQLFGLTRDELLGRRVEEFVEDVRGADVGSAWQQFQDTGTQRGECRLVRPDGDIRLLEYSAKADFSPGLHLSILRDVTERKRVEEVSHRQSEQLSRSNADLQQFAYVASHDLREPLRTLTSFSEILRRRYQGRLDSDADEFLDLIVAGADRMKGLIDSLLQYSRVVNIDAMPFTSVPLESVLYWAKSNLQGMIDESHAVIESDPLPTIDGDQVQLAQLFQNLISNAIKYRAPEKPPHIRISTEEEDDHWLISVRDNGIGIKAEHAERVFGIFKRLHGGEIPGTGIGLAICRRIVEKHGGKIWVESSPGGGANFRFTLPKEGSAPAP